MYRHHFSASKYEYLTKAPIQLRHLEMKLKIGVACIVDAESTIK